MTSQGGTNGYGNIFSVGTGGTSYQNLVSFTGNGGTANGENPWGSLTLAGTTFYGMTRSGGLGGGNIFSVGTDGTSYHNLVSFSGTANGIEPFGSLILSGTTLYGTSQIGGSTGEGNIFSVGIDGSDYEDLYDFTAGSDGGYPYGDLTLSGGTLFGMTYAGGDFSVGGEGAGTVFALVVPEPGTLALAGARRGCAVIVSLAEAAAEPEKTRLTHQRFGETRRRTNGTCVTVLRKEQALAPLRLSAFALISGFRAAASSGSRSKNTFSLGAKSARNRPRRPGFTNPCCV